MAVIVVDAEKVVDADVGEIAVSEDRLIPDVACSSGLRSLRYLIFHTIAADEIHPPHVAQNEASAPPQLLQLRRPKLTPKGHTAQK
jgi:hypothetical protein